MVTRFFRLSMVVLFLSTGFLTGCGSSSAKVRAIHASPDESSLDVLVDQKTIEGGLTYTTSTDYVDVSTGSHDVHARLTGSTSDIADQTATFNANSYYTVLLAGYASSFDMVLLTDDNSVPTNGYAKLRMINASPTTGPVDIYIVAPGTDLTSTTPYVRSLAFESASSYQSVEAGDYEVHFTIPGSAFSYVTVPITVTSGQVRTIVSLNGGSGGSTYTYSILNDKN